MFNKNLFSSDTQTDTSICLSSIALVAHSTHTSAGDDDDDDVLMLFFSLESERLQTLTRGSAVMWWPEDAQPSTTRRLC